MGVYIFYLFGTGLIATSIVAILMKNPVHSVLSVVSSFFFLAGIYAGLSMQFLAVIQILVYAGAIMVLFIFIIMLFDLQKSEYSKDRFLWRDLVPLALILITAAGFISAISRSESIKNYVANAKLPSNFGSVSAVSFEFFGTSNSVGRFSFLFEVISILLLSAIVGAVVLAKRKL
ncbi:NADH-quinone oxidoreductase subunit J [bacterium]|nr:NADH-quinone oxidoreductase subunit J [bacterium]